MRINTGQKQIHNRYFDLTKPESTHKQRLEDGQSGWSVWMVSLDGQSGNVAWSAIEVSCQSVPAEGDTKNQTSGVN